MRYPCKVQLDEFQPNAPGARAALDLFLISVLGLFLEILLIRWLSAEVRLFAYLQNLTLLACFLGLGIGFALARRRRSWYPFFLPMLWAYILLIALSIYFELSKYIYNPDRTQFYTWEEYDQMRLVLKHTLVFYGTATFFFLLTAAVFVPLGQLTGRLMRLFSPLRAYTINIFGSLVGVWAFSLICFLGWSPPIWLALAVLLSLWFLRGSKTAVIIGALISAALIFFVYRVDFGSLWSPYYKISVTPVEMKSQTSPYETLLAGYNLSVNHDYHQRPVNLDPAFVDVHKNEFPELEKLLWGYNLPYTIVGRAPGDVLVLGAGTGNDVAAALRNGARLVDAVEIDPRILTLGREIHPERPYQAANVFVFNDDARSFLKRTEKKYDLIVYGLLDSHTLLSRMSSLRLDSYMYTVESFRDARAHLKEQGRIVLSFCVGSETWLGDRIYTMLRTALNVDPLCIFNEADAAYVFIVGENVDRALPEGVVPVRITTHGAMPATDNWPFLYLKTRAIPRIYWVMMVIVLFLSVVMIRWAFAGAGRMNLHFFFLGSAFMLIEVKGITELSLIFGSTWLVNSIVISAILAMILLANLYISKRPNVNVRLHYALLAATLLIGYFAPPSVLLSAYPLVTKIVSTVLVSLPLFFSGIIFAFSLKNEPNISKVFSSNLLGAMVGGLLEYSSLIYGFKALYLFALALYLLSYVSLPMKDTKGVAS